MGIPHAPWDRIFQRSQIKPIDPTASLLPGFPGTPVGLPGQASGGVLPQMARADHVHTAVPAVPFSLIQPSIFIESTASDTVIDSAQNLIFITDTFGDMDFDFGGAGNFDIRLLGGSFEVNDASAIDLSSSGDVNVNSGGNIELNVSGGEIFLNGPVAFFSGPPSTFTMTSPDGTTWTVSVTDAGTFQIV